MMYNAILYIVLKYSFTFGMFEYIIDFIESVLII